MKILILIVFVQFIFQSSCENVTEILPSSTKMNIVFMREDSQNLKELFKKIPQNYPDINFDFKDVILDRLNPVEAKKTICNFLETNGISVVVDLTLTGFEQRKGISQMANIPYFHFDMSVQPFVHVMTTYLQARMANDAVFVFQTEEEADEALYYFIVRNNLRVIVLDKLMPSTIQRLKTLKPIPNFYAIVASTQEMNRIFKLAIDNQLITMPERWNIMFTDFQVEQFDYIRMTKNLSFLSLNQSFCCKLTRLVATCECPDKISLKNLLLEHFLNALIKILIDDNLTVHIQKCDETPKETTQQDKILVQLKEIFKKDNPLYVESDYKVGWNLNFTVSKLDESQSNLRNELFIDNDGVQTIDNYEVSSIKRFLRIGTVESPPWSFFKRDSTNNIVRDNDGNPIWTGYCIDFAEKIAERMNFDYEFVVPRSGRFGNKNKNGVWDGLIGDLVRGETDVIIAPLRMTAEREEAIDFVAPYFEQTGILIAMRKPVKETSLFKFMTVLRLEVWMSILAALVVTALMIWFFDKYSPYSSRNNSSYSYPCREFTLKESFWFALTSFTPQGGGEPPKSLSGRTLVAAYWLFVVLMLATFTANLAAFLTVERMQTPVQSLEQLARQSRINYTVVKDSAAHKYFSNMKHAEDKMYEMWKTLTLNSSTDESIYRVYDYPIREQFGHILLAIETANPVETAAEGFRKVNERDDFALIHDSAEIRYEISKNCNLTEVGEVFGSVPYSIAVQEGSHLQDDLSKTILTLQKDRYLEALTAKYWNYSVRGVCEDDDNNEGITLESLGGVFIATLFGLALAMITLFGEIIYYKKKDEKNLITKVAPINSSDKKAALMKMENAKQVTLGDTFIPTIDRKPRLSYISMFSKPEEGTLEH